MDIKNSVVLITGANRGLGLAFARAALARGARKVYAGARNPASITLPGVQPVRLDVTQAEDVAAAAAECGDVTIVINNAGIAALGGFLAPGSIESARTHLETNFFGVLRVSQAFAPTLAANGGGALVNVLSVLSLVNAPVLGAYAASKSAVWGLTNGLRNELRGQGTQVLALHMGFVNTDLTRGFAIPKTEPDVIVDRALDALAEGRSEVLADEFTQKVKQSLAGESAAYLRGFGE